MARAIRASASPALIVHSEKGFDSRKSDEGRMAHPPFGMTYPWRAQLWWAPNCSLHSGIPARGTPLPSPRDAEAAPGFATHSASRGQSSELSEAAAGSRRLDRYGCSFSAKSASRTIVRVSKGQVSGAGLRDGPGHCGDFLTPHPSLQHFPKRFCNYIGRYIIISQ